VPKKENLHREHLFFIKRKTPNSYQNGVN